MQLADSNRMKIQGEIDYGKSLKLLQSLFRSASIKIYNQISGEALAIF
jgi:hypothetical protein